MAASEVGNRVRGARQRAGLTQRELARRSGVPQPHISAIEAGRVLPTERTVTRLLDALRRRSSTVLHRHRADVLRLIGAHRGHDPRVFGSVATGQDTEDSDIDLLVSFEPGTSIFELVALTVDLEEVLGVHVDVVGDAGDGAVVERARREAVPL